LPQPQVIGEPSCQLAGLAGRLTLDRDGLGPATAPSLPLNISQQRTDPRFGCPRVPVHFPMFCHGRGTFNRK
jgi:hypothetical protein